MTKSSGSMSFRSSRKKTNSSKSRSQRNPVTEEHTREFPFKDTFQDIDYRSEYDRLSGNSASDQNYYDSHSNNGYSESSFSDSYRSGGSYSDSSFSGGYRSGGSYSGGSFSGGYRSGGSYSDGSFSGGYQSGGSYSDSSFSGGYRSGDKFSDGSFSGSHQSGGSYSDSSFSGGYRTGGARSGGGQSDVSFSGSSRRKSNRPKSNRSVSYRNNKNRPPQKKKASRKPGCLIPLIIAGILFVLLYALVYKTFSDVEKHKLDMSSVTVNKQDKNMKKYQMIALFGVDNQDNKINDIGSRTDSIMVAAINKRTKDVKLMSIYRDTYVSIDGKYDKINAAYSYGGPEQAINTINRNLDLGVTDFATVNFKALADAVDILGGIELTIESEKELENLNDYIGNMNKINGGDSPKFDEVGTYTFDGNQAVAYSRIRYMAGGDHARAGHQRLVVEGILKKAKRQPWKIPALTDKVLPQCKTSFSTGQFTRMAMGLAFYDISDSQAYPFDSFDERYDGIYYGFPTTVESNVKKAHKYLFGTKDYEPTDELKKISKKVKDVADMVGPGE